MDELVRTPRLLLRRWHEQDVQALLSVDGRPEAVRRFGRQPNRAPTGSVGALEGVERWKARTGLPLPFGLWAVIPDYGGDTAPPVGMVLLLPLVDAQGATDEVEIAWHLHPNYQGRGLATEAARAVLARAGEAGIRQVLALTDPDDERSRAVAVRLGMTDEGTTDRWFGSTLRQYRIVLPTAA